MHSEKMWYGVYELNPDTSFMYIIYEKLGILEETLGYIFSMTYGSKWMHICYHLYNVMPDRHPFVCGCMDFIILLVLLAYKDFENSKKADFRKKLIFYIIPFVVVLVICVYGFFVYAPQYDATIDDIISSV